MRFAKAYPKGPSNSAARGVRGAPIISAFIGGLLLLASGCSSSNSGTPGPDAAPDTIATGAVDGGAASSDATMGSDVDGSDARAGDGGAAADGSADGGDGGEAGEAGPPFMIIDPDPCGQGSVPAGDGGAWFDFGPQALNVLRLAGTRLLTVDTNNRWTLWDTTTRHRIASGLSGLVAAGGSFADLVGSTLAVANAAATGMELRSAQSGALLTTISIPVNAAMGLATDGSYLWSADGTGLRAWLTDGTAVPARTGNYGGLAIYAAPSELRVGNGAAGAAVIERVAVPSGVSTTSSTFHGTFDAWFADGATFFSGSGSTVWINPLGGSFPSAPLALTTAQNLGGTGNHFWTLNSTKTLTVYSTTGGSTPVATFMNVGSAIPFANSLFLRVGQVLSLATLSITTTTYNLPPPGLVSLLVVAPDGRFAEVNGETNTVYPPNVVGLVFDSDQLLLPNPRPYGCGPGRAVAGAMDAGTVVFGTAAGVVVGTVSASGNTLRGIIPFPADMVALSASGDVLGAQAVEYDQRAAGPALGLFSLASGSELHDWVVSTSPNNGIPRLQDFSLSANGTTLGRIVYESNMPDTYGRAVSDLSGANPIYSDTSQVELGAPLPVPGGGHFGQPHVAISPSGALFAIAPDTSSSRIYSNGVLVGLAAGMPMAWLDESHLLTESCSNSSARGWSCVYGGLFDSTGAQVGDAGIPLDSVSMSSTEVYSAANNAIYNFTTGATVWTGASSLNLTGAYAGGYVVTIPLNGSTVMVEKP
jgi:hypothetical protein